MAFANPIDHFPIQKRTVSSVNLPIKDHFMGSTALSNFSL